jgi:uncharacterized protein
MRVTVCYAEPDRATRRPLDLPAGATVADALAAANLAADHPNVDFASLKAGVYGRVVAPAHPLREGDRVEVYRPVPPQNRALFNKGKKS